ncbi:adhesion G-protein coupled receptor D1-like [Xenia sp. Carnegie-2017]|uniref:adhesion G-protein coupled receptor D1-like n=1 Tax=Xenia sp. Carnegie-2017 TaxID=2897299 RepID=UPI001F049502|nr:adhesion G-protein coupled receptor D1-like [Xenia sp. Carnegie-2017]
MKKLQEDYNFLENLNTSEVNINDDKTITSILDAAANLIATNSTFQEDAGGKAVQTLEILGDFLALQLVLGNESSVIYEKVTKDLVFGVAVINTSFEINFKFPITEMKELGDDNINIPNSVFGSESDQSYFVGIIFKAYREMRENTTGSTVGTKVINARVSPSPSANLVEPVEMLFEKINMNYGTICSLWIENENLIGDYGRWSSRNCSRKYENDTHILCQCNHFTNFAVLFRVSDDQDSFTLSIITYVGLGFSIVGCFLTFLVYTNLKSVKTERVTVHINLVFALGLADVIFLVTIALEPDGNYCLAASMLAFYFYLAVFFWMLVEGVYIYLMVVEVFRGNVTRKRKIAYLVGWVLPLCISLATWAIMRDDILSKYHCWLSVETGAIWSFVAPGLTVIFINFIILLIVIKKSWKKFVNDKEYNGLKSAMKTFAAIIPLLGITWIFGVMTFNESSLVFQYIFAATNSVQGALIFFLYCIINNEVRNELKRKFANWQTRRDVSSSAGGGRMYNVRRHNDAISSENYTTFNRTTSLEHTPVVVPVYPLAEVNKVYVDE